jgi:hypothetical protein
MSDPIPPQIAAIKLPPAAAEVLRAEGADDGLGATCSEGLLREGPRSFSHILSRSEV